MTKRIQMLAALVILAGTIGWVNASGAADAVSPFPAANIHIEHNATDGDYEVVLEIRAGDEGLAKLTVTAPDGRNVVDFSAPEGSALGMRMFRFETPEPGDFKSLQAIYPEGEYTFNGTTAAGAALQGKSSLSHKLPATTTLIQPKPGARGVGTEDMELDWSPVNGIAGYILEIEQDELGINITSRLPASISSFTVPDAVLRPGKQYHLGIATVAQDGNTSFIETTFTTRK